MTDRTVTIESPHPGVNRSVNVTSASGAVLELPVSFMLVGNAIERKGVVVKAPSDIAVYAFSLSIVGSGEAYAALQAHKLGTRYISATYSDSYITVIAYEDDTHVNVTVGSPTQPYNGRNYRAGGNNTRLSSTVQYLPN